MRRNLKLLLAGVIALPAALALSQASIAQITPGGPITGSPPGVAPKPHSSIKDFPALTLQKGASFETRPPEKKDDAPIFPGQTRAPFQASVAFNTTMLTESLKSPWSMAFLPEGKILITEKPGTMRTLDAKGVLSDPIEGVPKVSALVQVGLLDLALDPDFKNNRLVFFSFSEPVGDLNSHIAIASGKLNEKATALSDVKVIFRAMPSASAKAMGSNQGGRIVFDREGNIFATIGDRSKSPPWDAAQRLDTHLGKIIKITKDGAPAPGNPFIGKPGALPEIYTMGHRSEEGLAIHPETGALWETEHGPRGGDELNFLEKGKNYGWPVIVHGIDYTGDPIGAGITAKDGMEQPRYYWDPVIAPSGLAFYTGTVFPQWKNSVLVGALRGQMISRLTLSGTNVVSEEPLLVDMHNRIRDVRMGPEGAVYVLTDNGKLMKITPK